MLISLLRRGPAWWRLRGFVFLSLAITLPPMAAATAQAQGGSPRDDQGVMSIYLLVNALVAFVFAVMFAQSLHPGDLVRALPVPLRLEWLSRTLALTLSGLLPLALMSAAATLSSAAWLSREWLALIQRDLLSLAAGWLLIVALLQGLAGHPASRWVTWGRARIFAATLGLLALAASVLALCLVWPWFPWVAAFSGAAILWWSAARMPEAADVVAPLPAAAVEVASPSLGTRPGAVKRCLRRMTVTGWRAFVGQPVLLLFGLWISLFMAGHFPLYTGLNGFTLTLLFFSATQWTARAVLRMGLALPLSRRRLFAWTVLPPFFAAALGVTLGWGVLTYMSASRGVRGEHVAVTCRAPWACVVEVPARCWRLAWRRPPVVETEAGALRPRAFPLLAEGVPLVAYHPYDGGTEPKAPFLAAQMSRAAHDILGISIPRGEIERRYLTQPSDSGVYVDTTTLTRDYGRVIDRGPSWRITWIGVALVWFLSLFAALGPRALSARAAAKEDWRDFAGLLTVSALWLLVELAWIWRQEAISGLLGELIRVVELCVPAHPLLAAPEIGVLLAGVFLFHERRFAQMDMPAPLPRPPWT